MSPVSPPVSSNGGKTFTMTFKPWKWSDGQTVGAADMEFMLYEIKAALKESPANWANHVPGYFPNTLTSMSTPNASTRVITMAQPVNPSCLPQDIIHIGRLPAHAKAKRSPTRPPLATTNP